MGSSTLHNNIKTIADTIVWEAEDRMDKGGYKDILSAIYAVNQEVSLEVGEAMRRINASVPSR